MLSRPSAQTAKLLRLKAAAAYLGIGVLRMKELVDSGEIKAIKLADGPSSPWYVATKDIDAWIERRTASKVEV